MERILKDMTYLKKWLPLIMTMMGIALSVVSYQYIQATQPIKVLVTGFEPFGMRDINTSGEVVKLLPEELQDGKIQINTHILPVEYNQSAKELQQAISVYQPDVIIGLGESGTRVDFRVETIAQNEIKSASKDNKGQVYKGQLSSKKGLDTYHTLLDTERLSQWVPQYDVKINENAGGYLCEYIFYHIMNEIHQINTMDVRTQDVIGGFIHLPSLKQDDEPGERHQYLADGLVKIIENQVLTTNK